MLWTKSHLKENGLLWYNKISHTAIFDSDVTAELLETSDEATKSSLIEAEATSEAIEILTGKPNILYLALMYFNALQLAEYAKQLGKEESVDPGVVALNYTWNEGHYDLGNAAPAHLQGDKHPVAVIYAYDM